MQTLELLSPALIISDIMMPVMDGMEFTARVRSNDKTKDIPIILLSALTSDEQRIKGAEEGADAYITKPFDPELLVKTAANLIEKHDMMKQRYAQATSATKPPLPEIITEERDKKLLDAIDLWLSDHIHDSTLTVDNLVKAMGYNRTMFFGKMKDLTGQTPADYIKSMRMNRAAKLLKEANTTIAEVAYQVGISEPHYFSKVFKKTFGVSPKEYQQGKSKANMQQG